MGTSEQGLSSGSPAPVRFGSQDAIVWTAFFASGAAALIYEICWIRKASLIFGSTTFAVSTVFAVFFLGLALGSYLFGRRAAQVKFPLRLFAVIEIAVGLYALATPWLFQMADSIYGVLYRASPDGQGWLGWVRAGVVGMIILPATTLMGGTLPLLCQQYAAGAATAGRRVGLLYGLNTLGAASGAAAAGFILMPSLGLGWTLNTAAALSLLCGLTVAWLQASDRRTGVPATIPPERTATPREAIRWSPLLLYFGVGFVALGLEVVWFRFLSLIIRNNVYTYSLVLTVVLLGIVLGSWLASWLIAREVSCARVFGGLQFLSAFGVIGLTRLPPQWWWSLGNDLWACALLLLIPAVLGGASFPLAVRLIMNHSAAAAWSAGLASAANTLGGVLGSLVLGFLVLPLLGLQPAIWILTLSSLLIGTVAWLLPGRVPGRSRMNDALVATGCVAFWFGLAGFGGPRLPADYLAGTDELLDYEEGYGSNLAVIRKDGIKRLEIDRWWQGEDRKNHQAMAAHIPTLLHPDPKSVLLVGAGTGQTAARFLMHEIERLDCVDIEPTLFNFIRRHFDSEWMTDERTRLIVEDGRTYLRHGPSRYDLISLEVGQVFRPGVAYFYTREAYEFARRRLESDGLLIQFVPLPFFTLEQFRGVVGTFLEVFPQSILWYNTSEVLLIGANAPQFPWRPDLAPTPPWNAAVSNDLDFAYWGGPAHTMNLPEVFLGGFLLGPGQLARVADPDRRFRDDLPVLDYATAHAHHLQTNEIAIARLLRDHAAPIDRVIPAGSDPELRNRVRAIQAGNIGDVAASALVRQAIGFTERGDASRAIDALRQALDWNADHVDANRRLGDLYFRQRQPDRALPHFAAAARIRPGDVAAQHGTAVSLHRNGRVSESIPYYERAVALDTGNAELRNNLGAALAEVGRYEEALAHLEEAVRLRPGYADAERNLGKLRQVLGSTEARLLRLD